MNILKLLFLYPAVKVKEAGEWASRKVAALKRQAICLLTIPPLLIALGVYVGWSGNPAAARWLAAIGGLVAALLSTLMLLRAAFLAEVIATASELVGKIKYVGVLNIVTRDQARKLVKVLANVNAWIAGLAVYAVVVPMWTRPVLSVIVAICMLFFAAIMSAGWFSSPWTRRIMAAFVTLTFIFCTLTLVSPRFGDAVGGLTDEAVTEATDWSARREKLAEVSSAARQTSADIDKQLLEQKTIRQNFLKKRAVEVCSGNFCTEAERQEYLRLGEETMSIADGSYWQKIGADSTAPVQALQGAEDLNGSEGNAELLPPDVNPLGKRPTVKAIKSGDLVNGATSDEEDTFSELDKYPNL